MAMKPATKAGKSGTCKQEIHGIGFNVHMLDYPSDTQHFSQSDGSKFFSLDTCEEAAKCQLCLQAVP